MMITIIKILLQILLDENNSNKIRENILQYIDNTSNIRINDKKIKYKYILIMLHYIVIRINWMIRISIILIL